MGSDDANARAPSAMSEHKAYFFRAAACARVARAPARTLNAETARLRPRISPTTRALVHRARSTSGSPPRPAGHVRVRLEHRKPVEVVGDDVVASARDAQREENACCFVRWSRVGPPRASPRAGRDRRERCERCHPQKARLVRTNDTPPRTPRSTGGPARRRRLRMSPRRRRRIVVVVASKQFRRQDLERRERRRERACVFRVVHSVCLLGDAVDDGVVIRVVAGAVVVAAAVDVVRRVAEKRVSATSRRCVHRVARHDVRRERRLRRERRRRFSKNRFAFVVRLGRRRVGVAVVIGRRVGVDGRLRRRRAPQTRTASREEASRDRPRSSARPGSSRGA